MGQHKLHFNFSSNQASSLKKNSSLYTEMVRYR